MKVINFFAGPGAGKSTMAALTFGLMKLRGISVELVTEYAKSLVWEERFHTMSNQLLITAKQYQRLKRLEGKVDFAVVDSALLFGLVYGSEESASYQRMVIERFNEFDNVNCFVQRTKDYIRVGRLETSDRARQLDRRILTMLQDHCPDFVKIGYSLEDAHALVDRVTT